jgi:hypothetical protein
MRQSFGQCIKSKTQEKNFSKLLSNDVLYDVHLPG